MTLQRTDVIASHVPIRANLPVVSCTHGFTEISGAARAAYAWGSIANSAGGLTKSRADAFTHPRVNASDESGQARLLAANVPSRHTAHTNEMRVGDYELSGPRVQAITFVHNRLALAGEL